MEAVRVDARDLAKLHSALQKVDKASSRQLTSRLRRVAEPLLREVQQAALALPSKDHGRNKNGVGFRQGIAKAAELRLGHPRRGAFARIRISGSKFNKATGKYRKLPRYMEFGKTSKQSWRRPAHARKGETTKNYRGKWITQRPHPYLLPTVVSRKSEIGKAFADEYLNTFDVIFKTEGL